MRPHVPLKAIDRMRLSEDDKAPGADFEAQLLNSRQAARYARRKLGPLGQRRVVPPRVHGHPMALARQAPAQLKQPGVVSAGKL